MEEKKKFKLVSSKKTRYLLPNILTLGGVCLGISSIKFSIDGIDIGYVLVYHNKNIMHYWFSFYDVKYLNDFPIGKFIMEKVIFYAKKNKMSFIYLGTCYGKKALYKVRDFKGIEYFDGNKWESNIKNLKELCKNDSV